MKIAVSGASGFVGRALTTALHASGHDVMALELRKGRLPASLGLGAVVHLAAIAHQRGVSRDSLRRVNVDLAREVGRWAAAGGMPMVFVSSVKVHGEAGCFDESCPIAPRDAYAESKALAEEALRAIPGLRLTVIRPPLVYGPGVKANFLALATAVARGWPLPFAVVVNRRSLVYVDNLADAIAYCITQAREGTYLVSDGEPLSTAQLCHRLGSALKRPARLFPFPARLLPQKLAGSLEVDDSALRATGWRPPFSTDEGLRITADWYKGRG